MTALTHSTPVIADGEYSFPALRAGNTCLINLSGTFGSGTATLGYVNASGSFTSYKDANGTAITLTAAGGITVDMPESDVSGKYKPAISLSGATSPSITVTVTKSRA